jgi:hypothetical protein
MLSSDKRTYLYGTVRGSYDGFNAFCHVKKWFPESRKSLMIKYKCWYFKDFRDNGRQGNSQTVQRNFQKSDEQMLTGFRYLSIGYSTDFSLQSGH